MYQKYILFLGLLIAAVGLGIYLLTPQVAGSDEPEPIVVYVEKPALSPAQIIWLAHLMQCESRINEAAINPKDLDNTPSLGLLQFKQGTFDHYSGAYGIEGDIMQGEPQVAIVTKWLLTPGEVDWTRQFPACVELYGLPPTE